MNTRKEKDRLKIAESLAKLNHIKFEYKNCTLELYSKNDSQLIDKIENNIKILILPKFTHDKFSVMEGGKTVENFIKEIKDINKYEKLIFKCPRLMDISYNNGHDHIFIKNKDREWILEYSMTNLMK